MFSGDVDPNEVAVENCSFGNGIAQYVADQA